MALSGRLQEFGVAEALGLVARQEKTGQLDIEHRGRVHSLFFERGKLIQARRPLPDLNDGFLRFLRELRVVASDDWRRLADWQKGNESRDPLEGLILLEICSRDELRDWLILHTQSIIDRLLELTEGSFHFEARLTAPRFGAPLAETMEFMIMEAGRRNDEAHEILASRLPPSGVVSLRPGQRPTPSNPIQGSLLRLIDGARSVQEILRATTIPRYDALIMLVELVEAEAATVQVKAQSHAVGDRSRSHGPSSSRITILVATTILVIASVYVGLRVWLNAFRLSGP